MSKQMPAFEQLEPRLLMSGSALAAKPPSEPVGQVSVMEPGAPVFGPVDPEDAIADTFQDASSLQLDGAGAGAIDSLIDYGSDVDILAITATQTGLMTVDVTPSSGSGNLLSVDMGLYDASTALLAQDVDPSDATASLSVEVVNGQVYYVRIASLNGESGGYELTVSTDPDDPEPPSGYAPGAEVSWLIETQAGGARLVVLGTDGADEITVSRSGSSTLVMANGVTYTLTDSFAEVRLYGFGGDDLLVSISGSAESVWGGAGSDSFWVDGSDLILDADSFEIDAAMLHQVTAFYQPTAQYVSLELAGQDIADPQAAYAYTDAFAGNPLFVNAPSFDDVAQGAEGDCYLMAALASLAESDPDVITQAIAPMGDGTYAVRFYRGGAEVYLRIDADLPNLFWEVIYADLTPDGELWVSLMEKAYAQFRTGANSYASLEGGWMDPVYEELTGVDSGRTTVSGLSNAALAEEIAQHLADGEALSAGTSAYASLPIGGSHAYVINSIENVAGEWFVTVYNVWGQDGTDWDSNRYDGVLVISMDIFQANFTTLCYSLA